MKIWTNLNDVIPNSFCSEQMVLAPYLPIEWIERLPDYHDIRSYIGDIQKTVTLVNNIEDCQCIIFPRKLEPTQLLQHYIDLSRKHDKKVLCFYNDDNANPIALDSVEIFRTSLYKSKQKRNEHAMPAWSIDFKPHRVIRQHARVPVVGFCGFVNHQETDIRRRFIEFLDNSQYITTNFIIRDRFWGGKVHDPQVRKEYIENMQNSDYILCTRGSGNFSYRLYETLSMGRIPVFIDTDCVLPFDRLIRYDKYFPIVKEDELLDLEIKIIEHWEKIDYNETQNVLREIYEDILSPAGFVTILDQLC